MSDKANPMEPIRRLAERLQETAEALGLTMRNFAVMPSMDGGPDHAQVIFTIKPEDLVKTDEQAEFDRQFEDMMKAQKASEREEAFDAMPDKLQEILRRTRGILPENGEEGSPA